MRLPRFECLEPGTVQEACSLLADHKEQARVIAGGTDLLVKMKDRELKPRYIIRLKSIPGLNSIEYDGTGVKIGALATLSALRKSPLIREHCAILGQALDQMASPQVRTLATIGGNICNAVPSADTAPALLTLDAKVTLVCCQGERTVGIEEFFTGPNQTVCTAEEIVREILVPDQPAGGTGVYLKLTPRKAMDLAVVGIAVMVVYHGQVCEDIKIALGAVAPTPIRARKAEEVLKGKKLEDSLIEKAAGIAAEESKPIDDFRASAEYRREMVDVLVTRAIQQAVLKTKTMKI
jgi:carbon-monoxide dehydrogenase medium subunit